MADIIAKLQQYDKITANTIQKLFTALEKVRAKFADSIPNSNAFTTNLYTQNSIIKKNTTTLNSYPQTIKNYMEHIELSPYVPDEYAAAVNIPDAGTIIYAGTYYNDFVDQINEMYDLCIHNNSYCSSDCGSVCGSDSSTGCDTYTTTYSIYEINGQGYYNKTATGQCPSQQNFNTGYSSQGGAYYSTYGGNSTYCTSLTTGYTAYCSNDGECLCVRDCSTDFGSNCGAWNSTHCGSDQGCSCIRDCGGDCGGYCAHCGCIADYGCMCIRD